MNRIEKKVFRELLGAVIDLTKVVRELAPGNVVDFGYIDKQLANAKDILDHPLSSE